MVAPLIVVYVLMLLPYAKSDAWPLVFDVVFAAATIAVAWIGSNVLHRKRMFGRIQDFGIVEAALFVLVPAIMTSVFSDQGGFVSGAPRAQLIDRAVLFAGVALIQVVVFVVIWLAVSLGALALVGWFGRELRDSLASIGVALSRTVPLLLTVATFFFFSAESWQLLGVMDRSAYLLTVLVFVLVSGGFLAGRWQLDLDELGTFASVSELESACSDSPLTKVEYAGALPAVCHLGRLEVLNLRLMYAVSRLLLSASIGAAAFVFYMVLGLVAIDEHIVKAWTQSAPTVIGELLLAGHAFLLSWEHVKVAGFMAVLTGFVFAVVSATDASLRQGLRDTVEDTVRELCAVRVVLLARASAEEAEKTE